MNLKRPVLVSICWYGLDHIDTGGKVRTFNILKYMQTFTPWVIAPEIKPASGLNAIVVKGRALRLKKMFNGEILNYLWPDKIWRVRKRLKEISPDLVQSEGIWSFPAVYFYCRDFRKKSILVINNIEHKVAEELYGKGWRALVLETVERYCYRRADLLVVCSDEDRSKVVKNFSIPEQKIIVIPNGVEGSSNDKYEKVKGECPYLLFMGKLDYGPNREAISFITKKLMPRLSDVKCMILGNRLKESFKNVEFLGRVDDVRKYLAKADICLAPIWSGSGTRLKVLEYLARAKPMVATSKAVEGLGLEKGKHFLEAEDITQFENAIREILDNPEKWKKNAIEAREFVLSRYNWQKIVSNYERELEKILI